MPEEIDKYKTWQWLCKSDLKIGTEALLWDSQEQAIRIKSLCRLCREKGESVQHVVTECEKLAQKEYKTGHKNVGKKCRKWKNESVVGYQCSVWQRDRGKKARHNCNWKEKTKGIIINIAVPADVRVGKKKGKKWKECL